MSGTRDGPLYDDRRTVDDQHHLHVEGTVRSTRLPIEYPPRLGRGYIRLG